MSKKHIYKEVKSYIESYGYQLLSTEYKNSKTKLEIQCPKGHIIYMLFPTFKTGNRCKFCSKKEKYSYDYVKSYIKEQGYKLLLDEYKNNRTKLKLCCSKGHIFNVTFYKFKSGNRCPYCYGNVKYTYNEVKEYIESFNYKLLSTTYGGAHSKLKIQCPKGHIYKVTFGHFKNGDKRCPKCSNNISNPEKEIQYYCFTIYNGKIKNNDKSTIINSFTNRHLELDIYLPEINKAIEFNGKYWHSDKFPERKTNDKIKLQECQKANIDLLVIKEQDWLDDKNNELEKIRKFIL